MPFKAAYHGGSQTSLSWVRHGLPLWSLQLEPVLLTLEVTSLFVKTVTCTLYSTLRILRAASTHYPVLRKFLSHGMSECSQECVWYWLPDLITIIHVESLLSCYVEQTYQMLKSTDLSLRRPSLETTVAIALAALIAGYEKEIYDYPENVCICCECVHQCLLLACLMTLTLMYAMIWRPMF